MLRDSGYLHEKDAQWENRKRDRKGMPHVEPLYTQADGEAVMAQFRHLYESVLFKPGTREVRLPNLTMSRTSDDSMAINRLRSETVVIAGSGMCSGGRVLHHLKHNVWRPECHVMIVGFQAHGTLGRRLVHGAEVHIPEFEERLGF